MTTLLVQHPVFGDHQTPEGHPEQPGRYAAVSKALSAEDLDNTEHADAPRGAWPQIGAVHGEAHISAVLNAAAQTTKSPVQLDPDTHMGPASLEAALRGAGGACAAVDAVATARFQNAFVAARPPGHHAVPDRAMGFCIFNNAAVAALHARKAHGLNRVAIVDFDVHHGNGTQAIFENDPDAFFASSHEWPQYPGSGRQDEVGTHGQCHNAILKSGDDGDAFRRVWGERLLPALDEFDPDIILVSAGFDGHAADPLGGLNLVEDDFAWITAELMAVAQARCGRRLISVLEGGYDLDALANSVTAHVKSLATGSAAV